MLKTLLYVLLISIVINGDIDAALVKVVNKSGHDLKINFLIPTTDTFSTKKWFLQKTSPNNVLKNGDEKTWDTFLKAVLDVRGTKAGKYKKRALTNKELDEALSLLYKTNSQKKIFARGIDKKLVTFYPDKVEAKEF